MDFCNNTYVANAHLFSKQIPLKCTESLNHKKSSGKVGLVLVEQVTSSLPSFGKIKKSPNQFEVLHPQRKPTVIVIMGNLFPDCNLKYYSQKALSLNFPGTFPQTPYTSWGASQIATILRYK